MKAACSPAMAALEGIDAAEVDRSVHLLNGVSKICEGRGVPINACWHRHSKKGAAVYRYGNGRCT